MIYAVRNDRLGGRLGALLNSMRIAQDYGMEFRFAWASHENVSPELRHPEQLFSTDFLARYRETERGYGDLQRNLVAVEQLPPTLTQAEFKSMLDAGNQLRCTEAMRPVCLPWENRVDVSARLATVIDSIDFDPTVREAMDNVRARLTGERLVAYHLRRGDIIDPEARPSNTLWPSKYMPLVYYEEHIGRVLRDTPLSQIVIFSDSAREVALMSEMSDRVIAADRILADFELTVIQRDFMELFTMSCCKDILGPGGSAFSSLAALLGNGTVKAVKSDLTPAENHAAMMRLTERLDNQPEVFSGDADLGQNFPDLLSFHHQNGTASTAVNIIKKHFDRGFSYSYIYDLMTEQYFLAGDAEGAMAIVDALQYRPIRTDLANSQSYAWAGLACLAAGRNEEAARLAQSCNWLNPIQPVCRILNSALIGNELVHRDRHYPISSCFVTRKPAVVPKFREISTRLNSSIARLTGREINPFELAFVPFELELRDWQAIQTTRLPAPFWNIPNQHKTIGFFQSSYRRILNEPAAMSMLGQMMCQADMAQEGCEKIEKAVAQAPGDPFTQIRLARLRMRQKQRKEALDHYRAAAELSGSQTCFLAEHGIALFSCGEKDAASEIFQSLAKTDHSMIEILILSADILRRRGNTRELALELAQKADRLAPGGLRSTQILRKVLEQLGRIDEAEEIRARLRSWKRVPGKFSTRL